MDFLSRIKAEAQKDPKRIVFAEGTEPRVREAAARIEAEGLAFPILLGDPATHPRFEAHKAAFQTLRGTTPEEADAKMRLPHYFATMMLQQEDADGMIAGPTAPSRDRILPALEIIKAKDKFHKVSGYMIMILPESVNPDAANGGVLLFADCAVLVDPSSQELADIAMDTAQSAKFLGLDPKIALLSFSTHSSDHPTVKKIREAVKLIHHRDPSLIVEGEMQVDAALMDDVAAIKDPGSPIAGQANVLIFPDLEAGNIGYKLVERLAGATAIGPILQGLNKPVNEVSRGCGAEDIVNLAALTSLQA